MAKKDYYDVLGINKQADSKQIKSAYRKLAKKYHPDSNPGDKQAEQMFKEVTEAYNVLSDEEKRKLYDQFGHAAFDGSMGADSGANTGANPMGNDSFYTEYHFSGDNMDDIFGDMFGSFFHHGSNSHHTGNAYQDPFENVKGSDYHSDITVSFEEAAMGCEKVLHFDNNAVGSISVHIPAGIDDGQSVRLRGKGQKSQRGQSGDLLLTVHIQPNNQYRREGMNVYTKESIPYTTAVLGGEAFFHTLYGTVRCKVPAGSQDGSKIRLRGKGIVSMKDPKIHGDAYVILSIEVPKYVSPEERSLLEKLKLIENGHHHGAA